MNTLQLWIRVSLVFYDRLRFSKFATQTVDGLDLCRVPLSSISRLYCVLDFPK